MLTFSTIILISGTSGNPGILICGISGGTSPPSNNVSPGYIVLEGIRLNLFVTVYVSPRTVTVSLGKSIRGDLISGTSIFGISTFGITLLISVVILFVIS